MAKRRSKKKVGLDDLAAQADPTAAVDGGQLLAAARPVLDGLRKDLEARAEESPAVMAALRARHSEEKEAKRTADGFAAWKESRVAQVAASWFLSCVFVRTLEDRGLLEQNRLAGPGATDSQSLFFELAPSLTERDYLLMVFRELAELPAAAALFDRERALVWQLSPSAEAAKGLLRLFRSPSAEAPGFRFGQASTRFLGDLYQDLYEDVRKRYALLQTPDFVESFILDRTLEPAVERFGLEETTLIDPTCGSGHFLLGAFERLFQHRLRGEPGLDVRRAAELALDAVYGADINPYAVAIARFRLTLAYLEKGEIGKLAAAPVLPLHVVVADSLLHNPHKPQTELEHLAGQSSVGDAWQKLGAFGLEDEAAARDVLHRDYAAVVGNPPYITEKDAVLRDVYRAMYPRSAAGKYALAAPFCERFFQLGRKGGYVGQITANSFMKREFGKKLIAEYLPTVNLELIVNTSGAYIPGHGTPTVLLFGTHEEPVDDEVLTVLAKRGEPSTPTEPANGEVWSSIAAHWNDLAFENDYISVAKTARAKLDEHPWSLAGGGATELKTLLEERAAKRLGDIVTSIGFMAITGEDDVFARPREAWLRSGAEPEWIYDFGIGEGVRDWAISPSLAVAFPYKEAALQPPDQYPGIARLLWPYRRVLLNRPDFGGKKYIDVGRTYYEYHQVPLERLRVPVSIAFAFVATHNHFVLDRGGRVFNRTAPIIKLPEGATEDDHLALLAYLNSSAAAFWMKQVCQNRGAAESVVSERTGATVRRTVQRAGTGSGGGFEFAGTPLMQLPLPDSSEASLQLATLATRALDTAAAMQHELVQEAASESRWHRLREELVGLQEEVDWQVYRLFGLVEASVAPLNADIPSIGPGERPFEIRLRRRYRDADRVFGAEGNLLALGPPDTCTIEQGALIEARVAAIEASSALQLLECEEFKRRWALVDVQARLSAAGRSRDLDAAESLLAEHTDAQPVPGPDRALMRNESVPFLASYRYSESGLSKWARWNQTWQQQRLEDNGVAVSTCLPPKYAPKDFRSSRCFSLRGKLDVPKERFISYPGCESDQDGEPVYGWAGWNHLQRARALANLYQKRKTEEGWDNDRLTPMLAGLLELIPWVKQWHNDPDPAFGGLKMGDYYEQFLNGECTTLGLRHSDLESWRPARASRGRTTKKTDD